MAKFKVNKENLQKFVELTSCDGVIQFRDKKGIRKPLFNSFYIDVNPDGRIEVLTIDTVRKKVMADFLMYVPEVIEEGIIALQDLDAIKLVLKGKGLPNTGYLVVSNNETTITIESEDGGDYYVIRQRGNEDIERMQQKQIIQKLKAWKEWHEFMEDGSLMLHHKVKKIDVPYTMRIKVDRDDLLKVVGDTTSITKDNKTNIVCASGKLSANKGEANAKIKSGHNIKFENLGDDILEFDSEFKGIQTIVPNLFNDIEFHIRKQQNNSTAIWIKTYDAKAKIEANIALISILPGEVDEEVSKEKEAKAS
jgi:hypothetical protein